MDTSASEQTAAEPRNTFWRIARIVAPAYIIWWLWSVAFFCIGLPGLYWPHLYTTQRVGVPSAIAFVLGMVLLLFGFIRVILKKLWDFRRFFAPALTLIALAVVLVGIALVTFGSMAWFHQDSIRVDRQTYHAAARASIDESYFASFQCGPAGHACRPVHINWLA